MIDNVQLAAVVHTALEYGGIAAGVALYRQQRRRSRLGALTSDRTFPIVAGLLLGAAIGNKLAFFADRPDVWSAMLSGAVQWPGQSIVGGLLGGLVGVEAAKSLTGQRESTGDLMVWPIAVGLAIGRLGCFLAGIHDDTYGVPTGLPWGVDFGDGIPRHPTQLYEILFVLGWSAMLFAFRRALDRVPGVRFKLFLAGYLVWRLLIDGLKPVLFPYPAGLSGIQWICIAALIVYAPWVLNSVKRLGNDPGANIVKQGG